MTYCIILSLYLHYVNVTDSIVSLFPKFVFEVLTPSTSKCDCVWK